jgi:hypothetical protein
MLRVGLAEQSVHTRYTPAARNRLGRLRLGIGVTDASCHNPAVTAQAAPTLHLLTRGKAILGIGPGEREGNAPCGSPVCAVAWPPAFRSRKSFADFASYKEGLR